VECTLKALDIWKNKPEIIAGMQKRGMEAHFSWDDSALRYEELYLRLSSR
jgi:glycogen synthase